MFRRLLRHRAVSGLIYIPVAALGGTVSSAAVLATLPPSAAGLFFLCQSIMPFVLLFDMGLLVISTREIAFATGQSRRASPAREKTAIHVYNVYQSARFAGLAALLLTGSVIMSALPFISSLSLQPIAHALLLSIAAAALVLITYSYQGYIEGSGHYHLDRYCSVLSTAVMAASVTASAYTFGSLSAVFAAWYFGYFIGFTAKFFVAARLNPAVLLVPKIKFVHVIAAIRSSFSTFLVQVGAAVTKFLQYPVVAAYVGLDVLGSYFFVTRVSGTVDAAISVLSSSHRAIFTQLLGEGRYTDARVMVLSISVKVVALTLIAAATIGFILPYAMHLVASDYDVSHVPFGLIAIDLILMCASGTMTQFVIAAGSNPFAKTVGLAGVLTIALLFLLVPQYGLVGAASAQLLANAATNLWFSSVWFIKLIRSLSKPPGDFRFNMVEFPDSGAARAE